VEPDPFYEFVPEAWAITPLTEHTEPVLLSKKSSVGELLQATMSVPQAELVHSGISC